MSYPPESERIAQKFHEVYERLAPQYDYSTRKDSAKPWDEVPETNKLLMAATVGELLQRGVIKGSEQDCLRQGHSFNIVSKGGQPVAVECDRCGDRWMIREGS